MYEGLDGAVDAALEILLCQLGELPLYQVQSGCAGRRKVQVEPQMGQQPPLDVGGLVGALS